MKDLKMKKYTLIVAIAAILLSGCSSKDMRIFDHAVNDKYYPDSDDKMKVGPVYFYDRVRNERASYKLKNSSSEQYCRVRVMDEDGSYKLFYFLEPREVTSWRNYSVYSLLDVNTICGSNSDQVKNAKF